MKKAFSIIILMGILLIQLWSCSSNKDESNNISNSSSSTSESSNILFTDLPDNNGDGKEIWFLVGGEQYGERYCSQEIGAEELNNELINDAVYKRNSLVEDSFKVNIQCYATNMNENINEIIRNQIQTNDDKYQVVMPMMSDAAILATEGIFYDLKDPIISENLDLSKEWWDQRANEGLSINNKLYFTTGYISVLDNACTSVIIFNKTIIENKNLEDPYELVKTNKWTLDKLVEMARTVTEDTDGSGDMTYKDTWGFLPCWGTANTIIIASGEKYVDKKDDDIPELVLGGNRFISVLDKYASILGDKKVSLSVETISAADVAEAGFQDCYYVASDAFGSNRVLFRVIGIADLFELADYEVSYGILPLPKYDENQSDYYSYISPIAVPGVCIPITNTDPGITALVISAMAEASTDTLNKAYYDVMLKKRKVEDTESSDMLDIIFNSRVYDLGMVYSWGSLMALAPNSVSLDGQNLFVSQYDACKSEIEAAMQDTLDKFINQ